MSTAKIIELVGCSEKSFEDAVMAAFEDATRTIKNISGLDVLKFSFKVRDGKIVEYRAHVKVAFGVVRGETRDIGSYE